MEHADRLATVTDATSHVPYYAFAATVDLAAA
jgi:hypothetical protein